MKKIISLILVLVLLSSFALAGVEDELDICGDDVRCKFRLASEQRDSTSCESLEGELYDECRDLLKLEKKPAEERFVVESAKFIDDSLTSPKNMRNIIGIAIVSVSFILMILLLFLGYYKHVFFVRNHDDLVNFIKSSRAKKKSDYEIKDKLRSVGWDEELLNKAFEEADK